MKPDLDELEAAEKAMTPGPWKNDGGDLWHEGKGYNDREDPHAYLGICSDRGISGGRTDLIANDLDGIALLRNSAPALFAELRRLRADHADLVARNRVLRDRPDLPAERLVSYQAIVAENERLKAENAGLRTLCGEADNYTFWAADTLASRGFDYAGWKFDELSKRLRAASKGGES